MYDTYSIDFTEKKNNEKMAMVSIKPASHVNWASHSANEKTGESSKWPLPFTFIKTLQRHSKFIMSAVIKPAIKA